MEKEIIYAAQCSKHKVLYIGHTGEQLSERFSKHRYDIKNKPDNSELAKHFYVLIIEQHVLKRRQKHNALSAEEVKYS